MIKSIIFTTVYHIYNRITYDVNKIPKIDNIDKLLKLSLRNSMIEDEELTSKTESTSNPGGELQKFSLQVHCCPSRCDNSFPKTSFFLYGSSHLNSKPNPVAYLEILICLG